MSIDKMGIVFKFGYLTSKIDTNQHLGSNPNRTIPAQPKFHVFGSGHVGLRLAPTRLHYNYCWMWML